MIINQLFYMVLKTSSFSIYSLTWCRHCCTFTLHLGFCPIWRDPYRQSYGLLPSQRPTLLRMACSKLRPRILRSDTYNVDRLWRGSCALYTRANTVLVHSIFWPGRGVFIRERHSLLPCEQLVLWAKLNSAKFLCQYKVWALSKIFIQPPRIMCYTVYTITAVISTLAYGS